jgi:uncharacterized protein YjeT (DUF2065 family)
MTVDNQANDAITCSPWPKEMDDIICPISFLMAFVSAILIPSFLLHLSRWLEILIGVGILMVGYFGLALCLFYIIYGLFPWLVGLPKWWLRMLPEERQLYRARARFESRKQRADIERVAYTERHNRRNKAIQDLATLGLQEQQLIWGEIDGIDTADLDQRLIDSGVDIQLLDRKASGAQ